MATVAVVPTRMTRQRRALSHAGSIVALALASACASPDPAAVPQGEGPLHRVPPRGL